MKYTVTAEEAAFTNAQKISRGTILFDVTPAPKGAKTMLTDWIDTGLGSGRHLIMTSVVDGVYVDEIPVGEERVYFGRSDYFKDAGDIPAVPEVKTSVVLSVETGKFRLAVRVKPDSFEGTIRILWTAVKLEEGAAEASARAEAEQTVNEEKPTEEPETAGEEPETAEEEAAFYIENPPKMLHPGWKYTFRLYQDPISEQQPGAIVWSVSSESGDGEEYTGTIDRFGQLTAPERPGVIEVTAVKEGTDRSTSSFVVIIP